jgi:glutaminyl-tRNA synthetase
MYRIKRMTHHRVGDAWPIYPSYDFTHGQSDSLEEITHSLCSLEFEDHRPLYDWFIQKLGIFPSKQTEFARMNLSYTVLSKRKLRELVEGDFVEGWEDPRMPTLAGMRRRGYPAEAIRNFCKTAGVTKVPSTSDIALLEHSVRDVLNRVAPRRMALFDPLEIELSNWDEAEVKLLEGAVNPEDPSLGMRKIPFGKKLWIEQSDFREEANRKFFRLKLDGEVRLRNAYIIRCDSVIKDDSGKVIKLLCHVDLETLGKNPEDRKVKGVIHWLHADSAIEAKVRNLGRLFTEEKPEADSEKHFTEYFNQESSSEVLAYCEPSIRDLNDGETCQFERIGYFCRDKAKEAQQGHGGLYFNQTISLKDSSKF